MRVLSSSQVVARDHTLILGWNESTTRLICQLAFLRRIHKKQNETVRQRLFPWLRIAPPTKVAEATIVVLNNQVFFKSWQRQRV